NGKLTYNNRQLKFNGVLGPAASQEDVFQRSCVDVVDSVADGYNGTIMAYGQTGSGKTFTMRGEMEPTGVRGAVPRCL
ncbi:unnamed protein product, partial [Chrysoparadoxa australica]